MSPGQLIPGYVLHHYPYRDTSLLVEAFTADSGRVGLVARGVQRKGSSLRPLLEPFRPLLLAWRGRGELRTLTAAEPDGPRQPPAGRALMAGYYGNELVLRLLARDSAEPSVFAAYHRLIDALAAGHAPEAPLRRFELALLDGLGYAPEFGVEADTGDPVAAGCVYHFVPGSGPVVATAARPPAGGVRVTGRQLLALDRGDLADPDVLGAARRVLRASLDPHLGGRPLRTRAMYRSLYGDRSGN